MSIARVCIYMVRKGLVASEGVGVGVAYNFSVVAHFC